MNQIEIRIIYKEGVLYVTLESHDHRVRWFASRSFALVCNSISVRTLTKFELTNP